MDLGRKNPKFGKSKNKVKISLPKGEAEEEEDGERKSLLPSALTGKTLVATKKKNVKRRVQWNDDRGERLVQVLEFFPSDSSDDSEDEYVDSCICTIM